MANLTPAQRAAADAMINGTFANPAMQTQGWGEAPVQNTSMEDALIRQGIQAGIPMSQQMRPTVVANHVNRPTPAQLAAISNVPSGSYQRPPAVPINNPLIPFGSQYPDTGSKGRASGAMTQQLSINYPQPPVQPPPAPPPKAPVASWGLLSQALAKLGMQPPPVGANPGIGGALLGNGQMSPQIPPQGPPPAGIAPTVWAGQSPQVPPVPAARAPIVIGGQTYTPSNGAQSYALKNAAGQINALNRQATATGQTGVYNYNNGVRGTTVNGGSGASAYDQANAAAAARARANASKPSSQSSNSWFNSVTGG